MPALEPPEDFGYVRPKKWKQQRLPKGERNGYIDDDGNEWVKGPNPHFPKEIDPTTSLPYTYEWDVQIAKSDDYYNVNPTCGPQQVGWETP